MGVGSTYPKPKEAPIKFERLFQDSPPRSACVSASTVAVTSAAVASAAVTSVAEAAVFRSSFVCNVASFFDLLSSSSFTLFFSLSRPDRGRCFGDPPDFDGDRLCCRTGRVDEAEADDDDNDDDNDDEEDDLETVPPSLSVLPGEIGRPSFLTDLVSDVEEEEEEEEADLCKRWRRRRLEDERPEEASSFLLVGAVFGSVRVAKDLDDREDREDLEDLDDGDDLENLRGFDALSSLRPLISLRF